MGLAFDFEVGEYRTAELKQTLYAFRPLLNVGEVQEWATRVGLGPLDKDPHVTIAYSKTPIAWPSPLQDRVVIEHGRRSVASLGNEGAVVLRFESRRLQAAHRRLERAGASHDYESYKPHLTLTYSSTVKLEGVTPYAGPLVLGPEVYRPIDPGRVAAEWDESKHPRDDHGRWTDDFRAGEWDESKHPRGKSSDASTPGSFTSEGGGGQSELPLGEKATESLVTGDLDADLTYAVDHGENALRIVLNHYGAEEIDVTRYTNGVWNKETKSFDPEKIHVVHPTEENGLKESYVITGLDDKFPSVTSAEEWVSDERNSEGMQDEIAERFNREFWESPSPLYHATTEENADSIMQEGIGAADKTRGLSNRSVGSAVFTSSELDDLADGAYGDVIFTIKTGEMKKAGVILQVEREPDFVKYDAQSALAAHLGLDDFQPEEPESGQSPNTVIVSGDIPAKYIVRGTRGKVAAAADDIRAIADASVAKMRKAFLDAVRAFAATVNEHAVERLLERRDVDGVVAMLTPGHSFLKNLPLADVFHKAAERAHSDVVAQVKAAAEWDESKHPRVPAGSGDASGEFTGGEDFTMVPSRAASVRDLPSSFFKQIAARGKAGRGYILGSGEVVFGHNMPHETLAAAYNVGVPNLVQWARDKDAVRFYVSLSGQEFSEGRGGFISVELSNGSSEKQLFYAAELLGRIRRERPDVVWHTTIDTPGRTRQGEDFFEGRLQPAIGFLSRLRVAQIETAFDRFHPRAVVAANNTSADLVKYVTDEMKMAIKERVMAAFTEGVETRDLARQLVSEGLGLDPRRLQAVAAYRRSLVDDEIDPETVDRRVGRYYNAQLRDRAETIAITETGIAACEGQLEGWYQARDAGLLPTDAGRMWSTSADERTCEVCEPMDGETVGLDEPWTLKDGTMQVLVPTEAHPRCRCNQVIVLPSAATGGELMAAAEYDESKHPRDDRGRWTDAEGGQWTKEGGGGGAGAMVAPSDPALRRWFGDSKVVRADGQPKMVFHGTSQPGGVEEFSSDPTMRTTANELASLGTWFVDDPSVALMFTTREYYDNARHQWVNEQGQVMPVYLKIENPKIYERVDNTEAIKAVDIELAKLPEAPFGRREYSDPRWQKYDAAQEERQALMDKRRALTSQDPLEQMMNDRDRFAEYIDGTKGVVGYWKHRMVNTNSGEATAKYRESLQRQGYDGVILRGTGYDRAKPDQTTDQYVIFNPRQVKSISNLGRFDPRNPNIFARLVFDYPSGEWRVAWDESQHPRGKTSDESTPGSFAPAEGGQFSGPGSSSEGGTSAGVSEGTGAQGRSNEPTGGNPPAVGPSDTGFGSYVAKKVAEKTFTPEFAAKLTTAADALPAPAREWLDKALDQGSTVIQSVDMTDATLPDFLKTGLANAGAATMNGYKILFPSTSAPTPENLLHELTHVAYSSLERNAPDLVEEAVSDAAAVGTSMLDAAFTKEWRTKSAPEDAARYRAWYGAKQVRQFAASARSGIREGRSDLTQWLELNLMIPSRDLRAFAKIVGYDMPKASDQWFTMATFAALNERYNTTVSRVYQGEEFVTYRAGTDRGFAERLFSRLARARHARFDFKLGEWDESAHPRGKTSPDSTPGSFAPAEGGGGGGSAVVRTSDVNVAAKALAEGKKVELKQPRQVATLLQKLAAIVKDAKERGEEAPNYNLCNVSVAGTNLFCAESKGIPRIKMPQFSGIPEPGSRADLLKKDERGEVNAGDAFRRYLESKNVSVRDEDESAAYLRASQNELVGAKVAKFYERLKKGEKAAPLFVSRDNYVIDGHHHWAAAVGVDVLDNHLGDVRVPIIRIDMPITEVLHLANRWTKSFGIKPKKAARVWFDFKLGEWDEEKHPRVPAGSSEGGQFTGGAPVGVEHLTESGRGEYASAEKMGGIRQTVKATAKELGAEGLRVDVVEGSKPSSSGQGTTMAEYDSKTRSITIYAGSLSDEEASDPAFVKGIFSHEVMHDSFHQVEKQASAEFQTLLDARNTAGTREEKIFESQFQVGPDYTGTSLEDVQYLEQKYPAWAVMQRISTSPVLDYYRGSLGKLAATDGVSGYSMNWWTRADAARMSWPEGQQHAVNETLAEMSRLYTVNHALVGEREWKQLWTDVRRLAGRNG